MALVGFPAFNWVLACSRVVAWKVLVVAERFGGAIVPNSPKNRTITVAQTQRNLRGFIRDEPVISVGRNNDELGQHTTRWIKIVRRWGCLD